MRRTGLFIVIMAAGAATWASAAPVDNSPRPRARAAVEQRIAQAIVPREVRANPVRSTRPRARPEHDTTDASATVSTRNEGFQSWIRAFRGRAMAQGVSSAVFERAFQGVRYDAKVIERDRNQSEFTKTIWDYLDTAVSDTRIRNGKAALGRHAELFERIEARHGVEKEIVAAIWGLESAYGAFRGETGIVQALATLAFDGRRGRFFEAQLIAALQILQSGDTSPRDMTGSWAGAMGHTQFIPTSYLSYAVDFTGDGRRDIWSDNPADALASTAAYLDRFGWTEGQPWGVEVTLPEGFDYTLADREITRSPAEWARIGIVGTDGRPVGNHGPASILLPAGAQGAAFMIFENFEVLERYNTADAYVIGVGHLADRLAGGGPIRADWPRGDRALTFAERKEMQRRLTARGFDTQGIDGKVGPLTIAAVRDYQTANGMVPDGYASLRLLKSLR